MVSVHPHDAVSQPPPTVTLKKRHLLVCRSLVARSTPSSSKRTAPKGEQHILQRTSPNDPKGVCRKRATTVPRRFEVRFSHFRRVCFQRRARSTERVPRRKTVIAHKRFRLNSCHSQEDPLSTSFIVPVEFGICPQYIPRRRPLCRSRLPLACCGSTAFRRRSTRTKNKQQQKIVRRGWTSHTKGIVQGLFVPRVARETTLFFERRWSWQNVSHPGRNTNKHPNVNECRHANATFRPPDILYCTFGTSSRVAIRPATTDHQSSAR